MNLVLPLPAMRRRKPGKLTKRTHAISTQSNTDCNNDFARRASSHRRLNQRYYGETSYISSQLKAIGSNSTHLLVPQGDGQGRWKNTKIQKYPESVRLAGKSLIEYLGVFCPIPCFKITILRPKFNFGRNCIII